MQPDPKPGEWWREERGNCAVYVELVEESATVGKYRVEGCVWTMGKHGEESSYGLAAFKAQHDGPIQEAA